VGQIHGQKDINMHDRIGRGTLAQQRRLRGAIVSGLVALLWMLMAVRVSLSFGPVSADAHGAKSDALRIDRHESD
jgi:hypothetical protein